MNALETLLHLPIEERAHCGFQHTAREIAQQPATWARTWERLRAQLPEIRKFLMRFGIMSHVAESPEVFLVGAGTSDYVGRCLYHLLRQAWQCEVSVVPSTDLLIDFADIVLPKRPSLWVSFSRSGDSPEGVAVLERALNEQPQIWHLVVSCNAAGEMTRLITGRTNCLSMLLDEETNDQGLAMTSSFTNMLVTGQALAHAWSPEIYDPILDAICNAGAEFLPVAANTAQSLAEDAYRQICFVGSGALSGAATEAALKVLELTAGQVKTLSQTTLGLRHGPMAALAPDTLFASFLSAESSRQRYEIDLLHEIERKQLAGRSLAVLAIGGKASAQLAEANILAPPGKWGVPDLYRPAVDILFGQLLGLFSSLKYGLQPDTPSPKGTISRVVRPIRVY